MQRTFVKDRKPMGSTNRTLMLKYFQLFKFPFRPFSYNNKLYLHISEEPYLFDSSEDVSTRNGLELSYYEFDTTDPESFTRLDVPTSNPSARMNLFNIIDDKLFIVVPNAIPGNFSGLYLTISQRSEPGIWS